MEKSKQTLEAENADLAAELKSSASSKSELERKRKIAESQLSMYLLNNYVFKTPKHTFDLYRRDPE